MISSAHANTAAAGPDPMFQILMLVGFVAIFYFLLWRPQQKRAKEHRNLIDGLAKGDEVATGGGLMGRITRVSDDLIKLEISEGVEVVIQKPAVALLLPKGTMKDAAKA
ncbi:preprotein translocase subunit YajC [Litorivicinus sp.]|jgi:preprotein translocase subunit YajC|nr:preprotein translocase subunit YajC [Litorivicinus sp.]MDC1209190.1 preprotein translocase subunit YajC [Litorivicinus sp.]MDC1240102.1 preprotein translocase subunit YajC [Litorivicinus sp.]MDC1319394.1 preprotein translocase subunit YajC [Litorivicinus sp.]MDC1466330.1 preprotein translocase subunit YajC [Litorivicinus sp.]|tara:strand:- start:3569 stop:3895 length:327 start_codon:yes stop_codon:yes gene_type:complete